MIALLSCLMNSLNAEEQSFLSTGELPNKIPTRDSVNIAYSDLRIVNSKLIELEYTKQVNNNLREIVRNDSIVINNLENTIRTKNVLHDATVKSLKRERNIIACCGVAVTVGLVIALFCK